MTEEEALEKFHETAKEFDKYAGKPGMKVSAAVVETPDGKCEIFLNGPDHLKVIYKDICERLVFYMEQVPWLKKILPEKGDAMYRWTKAAAVLSEAMKQMQHQWN